MILKEFYLFSASFGFVYAQSCWFSNPENLRGFYAASAVPVLGVDLLECVLSSCWFRFLFIFVVFKKIVV